MHNNLYKPNLFSFFYRWTNNNTTGTLIKNLCLNHKAQTLCNYFRTYPWMEKVYLNRATVF